MDKKKVSVKNVNLKSIFEKMEYGEISENINLAKAWLQTHKEIFTFIDKKSEGLKGSSETVKDINTGEKLCTVFSPNKSDLQRVILRSKQSDAWLSKKPEERAVLINRLADEIQKNSLLFCQLEVCLRGILSVDTKTKALPLLIDYLQYYSSWAANDEVCVGGVSVSFTTDLSFVGFLGCTLGPALAAGYNLLIQAGPKISPLVLLIIELAENIGIPEDTLKILPGNIDEQNVFQNENVTVISSIGNFMTNIGMPTGKTFLAIANSKSPMIIFNSADMDAACDSVADAAWGYQGLLPWSINTIIVQEDIFTDIIEKLKYRLSKIKMASATNKLADFSFPSDANANKQLHSLINEAKLQGIKVYQSNEKTDVFQPTLLIGGRVVGNNVIKEDDNTAVVTILAFRTASEAINLANNTRSGFGASVWTENIGLANEVARGLNVGNVWINSHGLFSPYTSFTPYKKSGIGIFGGALGFNEFAAIKPEIEDMFDIKPLNISRSPTDKNIYKCPVGSDFHNLVMLAKKGYQSWSKVTATCRGQFLRSVANVISSNIQQFSESINSTEEEMRRLIGIMYSLPNHLGVGSSTIHMNNYSIQSYHNPIGVTVIVATDYVDVNLLYIILGSILLGNAIIVLCYSNTSAQFCETLSKLMYLRNLTSGVFNVVIDFNANVIKSALSDKEVDLYIDLANKDIELRIDHMQRIYNVKTSWRYILDHLSLIKNVWFNIGDSIL